jgi:hypothetical protein
MTVCQFCGTQLMEDAQFCYKCEKELCYPGKKHPAKTRGSCPICKGDVVDKNPLLECHGCKLKFCYHCEQTFRKHRDYREKAFCKKCFPEYKQLMKRLSMDTYNPE